MPTLRRFIPATKKAPEGAFLNHMKFEINSNVISEYPANDRQVNSLQQDHPK